MLERIIKMKRFIKHLTILLIVTFAVSYALSFTKAYASESPDTYSNDKYSIHVPETFSVDSETVANYTSIYNDNVTIGISTHNNTEYEDASRYTETQIADIANDTLDSLKAQSSSDIKVTKHEITSFSINGYPSAHIIYEGTMEDGSAIYMEEYIVTTVNYKYTVVLYADTADDVNNDTVDSITNSFTVLDELITHTEPADTGSVLTVFIISGVIVLLILIITLIIIIKYRKR